jgi:LPS-assembly lipoprotein
MHFNRFKPFVNHALVAADALGALGMSRRTGLVLVFAGGLGGCGFKLRGDAHYAFSSIAVNPNPGGVVALALRRHLERSVQVLAEGSPLTQAQVVLDVLSEQRSTTPVGKTPSGQVREFQLRTAVRFSLRTPEGQELTAPTEIVQQQDASYSESQALSKELEHALMFRDMQGDIVQQILRHLVRVKKLS